MPIKEHKSKALFDLHKEDLSYTACVLDRLHKSIYEDVTKWIDGVAYELKGKEDGRYLVLVEATIKVGKVHPMLGKDPLLIDEKGEFKIEL